MLTFGKVIEDSFTFDYDFENTPSGFIILFIYELFSNACK